MKSRSILPNTRYLLTRRCTQRQFWLRPSAKLNQIFTYCVAEAAAHTGVQIHAVCVLSNHWHAVVTDPDARLPEFLLRVHKHTACCINATYNRWENLWASEQPSAVRLEDDDDVLDKLAYCLTNPVEAGLVEHGRQWPGLRSAPGDVAGREYVVARPHVYFSENGTMPETATLRIVRPAICPDLSDSELAEHLEKLVADREAECRDAIAKEGRQFLGAKAVLRQRPSGRPTTLEPRREMSPRVAAKNKWRRIEALRRLKWFTDAYKKALELWRSGVRSVVFPAGTYAMRVLHQVKCESWVPG
jgi:REP element-mobilizing transposase RayT